MTYEQWLEAFNGAPGDTVMWTVVGVSVLVAWTAGHFTSKALRNGGKIRRLFVSFCTGLLVFVTISGLSQLLAQAVLQAPLVEHYPEYAQRQIREKGTQAAPGGSTRSHDPAVQACADIYRFNTNSADPDEWERTHDVGAGRKRATRRLDGSAVLHEGQQVYTVVIPRNGESVSFDRYGMAREGSGCQMVQDPDTGAWHSPYGL